MAQAKPTGQLNVFQRLMKYFRDVRSEMRRVVWPTRNEVTNSSMVVLVMLAIMTIFVGVLDYAASGIILNWLAKIGR